MLSKNLFVLSLLAVSAVAVPAKRATKGINSKQNVPTSDDEKARLGSLYDKRGVEKRGLSKMNCGHKVTGNGGLNGHGYWVPVAEFVAQAKNFCDAYTGTDIVPGHETSDAYPTTLTNQDDPSKPGDKAELTFAIYNQGTDTRYKVDAGGCYDAMIFNLGGHTSRAVEEDTEYVNLGKRDDCYGKKHNDYEGGYAKLDSWIAFGSEIYTI